MRTSSTRTAGGAAGWRADLRRRAAILSWMSVSRESFTISLTFCALLVEVEHLEHVGALAGQLLVADRVDVQLVAGDVLGLGALGGLEVDDRRLAGVQPA